MPMHLTKLGHSAIAAAVQAVVAVVADINMAETGRPSEAVARTQTAARRAGGAWNRHDTAALRANLGAAREAGLPRLMLEYGGLRFRYDFQLLDGAVATHVERMDDAPTGVPEPASGSVAPSKNRFCQAVQERHEQVALTATARNRRQKAARKGRDKASREQALHYVRGLYGAADSPTIDVKCDLWSDTMDLKMAFTKLISEVTHRIAMAARQPGGSSTKTQHAHFARVMYQVTVPSGSVAFHMTSDALSTDLIVLLAKGLNEERLATLIKRWSKPRLVGSA